MFCLATDPAPGRPGEDFALATPDLAVVVDAAAPPAADAGCTHGAPWFARHLGTHVLAALADEADLPLVEALSRAVRAVGRLHVYTCDLSAGKAPSASVAVLRLTSAGVDTLALGTCTAVVDTAAGPRVTGAPVPADGGTPAAVGADQGAARLAVTDSCPRDQVRRVALLSDGAAWPVGGVTTVGATQPLGWGEYLDLFDKVGAAPLLGHLRSWAAAAPPPPPGADGTEWLRDDATVVHATLPRTAP